MKKKRFIKEVEPKKYVCETNARAKFKISTTCCHHYRHKSPMNKKQNRRESKFDKIN